MDVQSVLLAVDNDYRSALWSSRIRPDLRPNGLDSGKVAETARSSEASCEKMPEILSAYVIVREVERLTHDIV